MQNADNTDDRAVSYLRISDPYAQTRETSRSFTVDQPETVQELAQRNGLEIVATFSDKQTGKTNDRPGFDELRNFIEKQQIHHLVCFHSDRLTRTEDIVERAQLVDFLKKHEVTVYGTDGITAPDHALMTYIKFSMNAEDNVKRRERVTRSHQTRMKEGVYRTGSPPYGLKPQSVDDPMTGHRIGTNYVIIEPDASRVRKIFSEFLAGEPLGAIAKRLNAEAIPTKREGAAWYSTTVKGILENPVFAGWPREKKTGHLYHAVNVEPLIDWDTSEAATQLLKEISWHRPGNNVRDAVFSGLLICKHCGSPLYRVACRDERRPRRPDGGVHTDYYWRCSKRLNGGGCDAPSIREDRLLALLTPGLPLIFGKEMWAARRQAAGEEAGVLRAELAALERQQKILARRELDGDIRGPVFDELYAPIRCRISEIEAVLAQMGNVPEGLDAEEIAGVLEDPAELKIWLRRCVQSFTIQHGKLVSAHLVDDRWNDIIPLLEEWDIEVLEVDPETDRVLRVREWVDEDDEEDDGTDDSADSSLGKPISIEVISQDPFRAVVAFDGEIPDSGLLHDDHLIEVGKASPRRAPSRSDRLLTTVLKSQGRSSAPSGSGDR